jgi:hypothetical protein
MRWKILIEIQMLPSFSRFPLFYLATSSKLSLRISVDMIAPRRINNTKMKFK